MANCTGVNLNNLNLIEVQILLQLLILTSGRLQQGIFQISNTHSHLAWLPLFPVWKGSVAGTRSICVERVEFGKISRLLMVSTHRLNTVSGFTFSASIWSLISKRPPKMNIKEKEIFSLFSLPILIIPGRLWMLATRINIKNDINP